MRLPRPERVAERRSRSRSQHERPHRDAASTRTDERVAASPAPTTARRGRASTRAGREPRPQAGTSRDGSDGTRTRDLRRDRPRRRFRAKSTEVAQTLMDTGVAAVRRSSCRMAARAHFPAVWGMNGARRQRPGRSHGRRRFPASMPGVGRRGGPAGGSRQGVPGADAYRHLPRSRSGARRSRTSP
jgi:hypothetical protein